MLFRRINLHVESGIIVGCWYSIIVQFDDKNRQCIVSCTRPFQIFLGCESLYASNFFCGPLDINRNIRGTLSWLRWKFSQHVHSMTLKMEMIVKILRRKSLVCLFTNINYVTYVQPVWLPSFRVEDTSILRMEVDQISLGPRVREIPFWLS
jgi:hypothetical protein